MSFGGVGGPDKSPRKSTRGKYFRSVFSDRCASSPTVMSGSPGLGDPALSMIAVLLVGKTPVSERRIRLGGYSPNLLLKSARAWANWLISAVTAAFLAVLTA